MEWDNEEGWDDLELICSSTAPSEEKESIRIHVVYKDLPPRFVEQSICGRVKYAYIPAEELIEDKKNGRPIDARVMYHCPYCKGWINGKPYDRHVSNLGPLCGRRGTASSCLRCNREIGF